VPPDAESRVAGAIASLAELSGPLAERGRFLTTECLVGSFAAPLHLTITSGRITAAASPGLQQSWRFAVRAAPEAWLEFWQPLPRPGWHDLFALAKRGVATIEGDLHPFMANLQYFKDLLALPRGRVS
jgi:hypothetical protein